MDTLVSLAFPQYPFRLTKSGNTLLIWDDIRKKSLILTPEEWVRQHAIMWLILYKNYPKGLFELEKGTTLNTLKKRTDILVSDREGQKLLLVECKAPNVVLNQKVFDQIFRYNMTLNAPLLFITNGLRHFFCQFDTHSQSYEFINDLPEYFSV